MPLKYFDFGLFNHTSNGKSDEASRSFNKSYVRGYFETESSRWVTGGFLQLASLYNLDSTNRDVKSYVGTFSFGLTFVQLFDAWIDKSQLTFEALPGGDWKLDFAKGGYQLSLAFRLGGFELVPSFYLQYYHGFAETLLNYNHNVDVFRVGFIF